MPRFRRIRSAITGRFATRKAAIEHPETTVSEQRTGRELRQDVLLAAAQAVLDSALVRGPDLYGVATRDIRCLRAAVDAFEGEARARRAEASA